MQLLDLSASLTVDVDKVIAIRSTESYDLFILVFKGGDTITITLEESLLLRAFSRKETQILSDMMKKEVSDYLRDFLDKYFESHLRGESKSIKESIECDDFEITPEEVSEESSVTTGWKARFGDEVIAYLESGHSVKQAAGEFGISERTVYRYMRERNVSKKY